MDIQPGTIYEVTSPLGVYVQPSNGTGTQDFTIDGSAPDVISGAVQVLADTTPILFADYDSQGDITTGNGNVVDFQSSSYANVQFNNIDRQTTNPMLNPTNAGRRFYASSDGGVTVRFFAFLRADNEVGDNGAADRVRFDRVLGVSPPSTAQQAALQGTVSPGDTIFMADVDDDGSSTSFFTPGEGGSATTLTAATLHGGQTYNHVSFGTKISSGTVFTIEIKR